MTEPTTEAGKALVQNMWDLVEGEWGDNEANRSRAGFQRQVARIEAEARDAERARIRAAVEAQITYVDEVKPLGPYDGSALSAESSALKWVLILLAPDSPSKP